MSKRKASGDAGEEVGEFPIKLVDGDLAWLFGLQHVGNMIVTSDVDGFFPKKKKMKTDKEDGDDGDDSSEDDSRDFGFKSDTHGEHTAYRIIQTSMMNVDDVNDALETAWQRMSSGAYNLLELERGDDTAAIFDAIYVSKVVMDDSEGNCVWTPAPPKWASVVEKFCAKVEELKKKGKEKKDESSSSSEEEEGDEEDS